ncbi:MAG: hypothetical protein QM296_10870 [Bacillota bacterium]|nr:hypothetical protein [Bacillota bacterium]
MNEKRIVRSSVFPAGRDFVFEHLQKLDVLQMVAAPLASFVPLDSDQPAEWVAGQIYAFRLRIFPLLPFGIHHIQILSISKEGIHSSEHNRFIRHWEHWVHLEEIDSASCRYTDVVRISAGWKTPLIALWAKLFYAHRQRRWRKWLRRLQQF